MSADETRNATERWLPQGACAILAYDIASFGDTSRTDDVREIMREAMYRQIDMSLRPAGLELADCYREDRGDGAMVLAPPTVGTESLLTSVVDVLKAELRRYNKAAADVARIRLRMAIHTGEARYDGNGIVGMSVNHAFRILDAQPFKDVLNTSGAALAVVVSQRVYEDVVRHGPGLVDPDDYGPVDIAVKETEGTAWVRVPGMPAGRVGQLGSEVAKRASTEIVQDAVRAPAAAPASPLADPMAVDRVAPSTVFDLVNMMIEVPLMATPQGREQVVSMLRGDIRGAVPRHAEARPDLHSLVTTCLDYPGGLHDLLAAVKGLAGESMPVLRLEQTIAELLPRL